MNKFNRCISLTFMLTSILPCGMIFNKKVMDLNDNVKNYYSSAITSNNSTKEKRYISKLKVEEENSISPYYVIFDGDESTSFATALSLSFNTSVSGLYNTRSDYDYFITSTLSNDVFAKFDINRGTDLLIYRKETSGNKLIMNYGSVTTDNIICLEKGYQYYFRITQNNSYTGSYSFEVETINVTNYQNYYMKYNYSNGSLTTFEVLYRDYSSAPSSNVRQGYNPRGSFGITTDGRLSTDENYYFDLVNNYLMDSNHNLSTNYLDDNRLIVNAQIEYPASTICYISGTNKNNVAIRGSSFFVDNNYLMTAAHVILGQGVDNHLNLKIKPSYRKTTSSTIIKLGEYYISESYFPMYWYQNIKNGTENHEYDWAILKVGETITEPTDTLGHGYLGIGYDNESSKVMTNMGYPKKKITQSTHLNIPDLNTNDDILMSVSSGEFYKISNFKYSTYIDVTSGNSGGPAFEIIENNSAIAYGIVSGLETSTNSYNVFSRIDKYSFSLLDELVG